MTDRTPNYVSSRSADVILSEVRPTRIRSDALRCVNVFLDELLWLVLSAARSLATDRLRNGLVKVLPTSLGKEALLEAEVELRAYWERTGPSTPHSPEPGQLADFPLQPAFELLRCKCEVYSTLGDLDEDAELETRLHAKMAHAGGLSAPSPASVAPAALYLTAVLEHVCEHILSNVGRVVARDSSRTAAHVQDLYVALCEDDAIYGLFKNMKVQEQIEIHSKTSKPRRSKSFTKTHNDPSGTSVPRTSGSSPPPVDSAASSGSKARASGDSSGSSRHGRKPSMEKPGAIRGNKNSNGKEENLAEDNVHARSDSVLSERTRKTLLAFQDTTTAEDLDDDTNTALQDFDDLMRSGQTMKVSLTPDRLKTFEVFKKERASRSALGTAQQSVNGPFSPPIPPPSAYKTPTSTTARRIEESIEEDEEDHTMPPTSTLAPPSERYRTSSLVHAMPADSKAQTSYSTRSRSQTESGQLTRGGSLLRKGPHEPTTAPSSPIHNKMHDRERRVPDKLNTSASFTKRNQRGAARNRESLDLDDLMDNPGSDEELQSRKTPMTPKSAHQGAGSTRDLIDFLSEGPPEVPPLPKSLSTVTVDQKPIKGPGRFRTIVSRLTKGGSAERLNLRSNEDTSESIRSVPLPAPPSISVARKQPSLGNLGGGTYTYPRPPKPPPGPSSHSHHASEGATPLLSSQPPPRPRKPSITRKAVPTWDSTSVAPTESDGTQSRPGTTGSRRENTPDIRVTPGKETSTNVNPNGVVPKPADKAAAVLSPSLDTTSSRTSPRPSPRASPASPPRTPLPPQPPVDTRNLPVEAGRTSSSRDVVPPSRNAQSSAQSLASSIVAPARQSKPEAEVKTQQPTQSVQAIQTLPIEDSPTLSAAEVKELRRTLLKATSAAECRLLVDLFLARCGFPSYNERDISTSTSTETSVTTGDTAVDPQESSLIELLLGDTPVLSRKSSVSDDEPLPKTPKTPRNATLPSGLAKGYHRDTITQPVVVNSPTQ